MALKVQAPKEIKWPVTVNIPRDGGNTTKAICNVRYKILPNAEFQAIYKNEGTDEDLLRNVVVGWEDDVVDESGTPIEFSAEALDKLIEIPYRRNGLVAGYMELSQGKGATAKN